jgi:hypothetical protein
MKGWIGGIRFDELPLTTSLKRKLKEHLEVGISVNSTANVLISDSTQPVQYIGIVSKVILFETSDQFFLLRNLYTEFFLILKEIKRNVRC